MVEYFAHVLSERPGFDSARRSPSSSLVSYHLRLEYIGNIMHPSGTRHRRRLIQNSFLEFLRDAGLFGVLQLLVMRSPLVTLMIGTYFHFFPPLFHSLFHSDLLFLHYILSFYLPLSLFSNESSANTHTHASHETCVCVFVCVRLFVCYLSIGFL